MSGIEFVSGFGRGDPVPATDCRISVGAGPRTALTSRTRLGFTGVRALRYRCRAAARIELFTVEGIVTEHTELSWTVFPDDGADPDAATAVSVDLEFTDGTRLSELSTTDQHGAAISPEGQARGLWAGQWNRVRCPLGAAAGRTVGSIRLVTAASGSGWLDEVRLTERPPAPPQDQVDHVRTTRGTHSGPGFSRGNTIPATAVPHGFNFWIPVTDAKALDRPYEYHRGNVAGNSPALQAFAVSHQPSPWIGDRHTFQFLPGVGELVTGRTARALRFDHTRETARPHHYGVRFDCGITVDLAPTEHAAAVRLRFPQTPHGTGGWVLFDNARNRGGLRVDIATGTVTGHTWVASGSTVGARRMFVYAEFDRAPVAGNTIRRPLWRTVRGYVRFGAEVVTMRIATSLISDDQARRNLDAEIPAGTTFEEVRAAARAQWQDILGRFDIEGATEDQLGTFYSNLYRMFLYPNAAHERTPHGVRHAVTVRRRTWPSTRRHTGAAVADGESFVNNGFWDTYRTVWPAYSLFTPDRCARLIDGFLRQYREGGWSARWSAPGYANLMTGTSFDVVCADAYAKGVRGFDVRTAYDAALRDATVSPPHGRVGRKGLAESIFLAFTPASVPEGMSWTLENCVNDFGLAEWSRALHADCDPADPRRTEFADNAAYFADRALRYVRHFDPVTGFFRGLDPDGTFHTSAARFDPTVWGGDNTETNAWTSAFAVAHDPAGLAALHGGRAALKSLLDKYFDTPETANRPGTYRKVIHEMREARAIRLGQYGHSNQPAHHIPYLYVHAGAPSATQRVVRDILARLYTGGEIGQGYPGDEDNGEMSAWYVLSALGFYPLTVGGGHYVIGSPLFRRATVQLENGRALEVHAPANSPDAVHVHGLTINGQAWTYPWVPHEVLAAGARLEFDLRAEPGDWGASQPPPSLGAPGQIPAPATDLSGSARGTDLRALFDDTTGTEVAFRTPTPVLEFTVDGPVRPVLRYTLTSAATGDDPCSWTLDGSTDGAGWTELDRRDGERFRWRRQTRPFELVAPATMRHYRLRVTASTGPRPRLAQWELLARTGAAR